MFAGTALSVRVLVYAGLSDHHSVGNSNGEKLLWNKMASQIIANERSAKSRL